MSSTTTNLGLTKPAYADEADIAVINGNMDLLDAAYGNINQSTMRPVPFAIAVSDWEAVTGGFSATYNSAYITTTSQEILTYTKSIENATAHIDAEKKSGGGGLVFTSAKKPTGTVQGTAYVFDNDDRTLPVIIEGTVTPIANGGTGQSSLAGAQSALGITALSEQIGTLNGKITSIGGTDVLLSATSGTGQKSLASSIQNYRFVCLKVETNNGVVHRMVPVSIISSSENIRIMSFAARGDGQVTQANYYSDLGTYVDAKFDSNTTVTITRGYVNSNFQPVLTIYGVK